MKRESYRTYCTLFGMRRRGLLSQQWLCLVVTGRTPCHVLLICGTAVLGHTTIDTTAALYHCSVASQFSMLLISAVLNLIIRQIVNKGRTIIIKQKSTRLFVRFYHVGNAEKLTTECCSAYSYKIRILY